MSEKQKGIHYESLCVSRFENEKLISVLGGLVEKGNTVIVIEHNLSLIANSDWVIDLGLEGGDKGGYVIAEGTPVEISKNKESHTANYLKKVLSGKVF